MEFCTECGGALNLFESNDDKICWNCAKKRETRQNVPAAPIAEEDSLADAEFLFKNNTLILRAKEGWVLWSGPADRKVSLGTIMNRARRIYTIRKKRQNHQE